ncbi:MAG: phytanoyl-CoA dioxygenase family protein [Pseudomonadales bacterium]|nr:phytanoyl-CoA dioxygenase family protein [Pseudomonadales bacterium]
MVSAQRRYDLSSEELAAYDADGFLIRQSVFRGAELERIRAAAERATVQAHELSRSGREYFLDGNRFVDAGHVTVQFEHQPGSDTIRVIEPVTELDDGLTRLLDDARIVHPMRQLVGSEELALWTDKLNLKRPREGSAFGWHQDSPYWMHDSEHIDQLPNVMLVFDDAHPHNGCLRMVSGSHTRGCLPGTDDGTQLGGFYTDPRFVEEARIVDMIAPAGSLVFFSPHVIHGSGPNRSDSPRRALVITYQPARHPTLKSRRVRDIAC